MDFTDCDFSGGLLGDNDLLGDDLFGDDDFLNAEPEAIDIEENLRALALFAPASSSGRHEDFLKRKQQEMKQICEENIQQVARLAPVERESFVNTKVAHDEMEKDIVDGLLRSYRSKATKQDLKLEQKRDESVFRSTLVAEVMRQENDSATQEIKDFLQRKQEEAERIAKENSKLLATLNAAKQEASVLSQKVAFAAITKEDVDGVLRDLTVQAREQVVRFEELVDESQNLAAEEDVPEDEKEFRKQLTDLDSELKVKHNEKQRLEKLLFDLDPELHPKYQGKDAEIARLEMEIFSEDVKSVDLEEQFNNCKVKLLKAQAYEEEMTAKREAFDQRKEDAELKTRVFSQRMNELKELKKKYAKTEPKQNPERTNAFKAQIVALVEANTAAIMKKAEQGVVTKRIKNRGLENKRVYGAKSYTRNIEEQILDMVKRRQIQINDVRTLRSILYHIRQRLADGFAPIKGLQKKEAVHDQLKNTTKILKEFFVKCEAEEWKKAVAGEFVEEFFDHTCNTLALQNCIDEERRLKGARPVGKRLVVKGGLQNKRTINFK